MIQNNALDCDVRIEKGAYYQYGYFPVPKWIDKENEMVAFWYDLIGWSDLPPNDKQMKDQICRYWTWNTKQDVMRCVKLKKVG